MVRHDLALWSGYDRVLLFHEGKRVEDGAADETIEHYRTLVS